jgi:cytochrome P450
MTAPIKDPIAAVTHPDPYPYYADLVAHRPLYRDETLGLWVASSAAVVISALTSEFGRVRPPAEPVPKPLLGSAAAEIFSRLVRMNDGSGHCPFNRAVTATLESIAIARAAAVSRRWAKALLARAASLGDFAFDLPVYVVASLLGVPEARVPDTALWMSDFVRGIAPQSAAGQLERGKAAAGRLLEQFRSLLADIGRMPPEAAFAILAREAARVGGGAGADVIVANGIGFMSQAYEATAGLIGNTLVTLARDPQVLERVRADSDALDGVVQEVLRFDPPVHNTRRFLARSGHIGGQPMQEGDAVLVVLAAANRDPAANPDPVRFDPKRAARRIFTFGAGSHACPGGTLAATIARVGVEQVLRSGFDPTPLAGPVSYRPSANVRIPVMPLACRADMPAV